MKKLSPKDNIVVLTGAGISAESGIRTFRDSGGLWENHRIEDIATYSGFRKNPALVWEFYRKRWEQSKIAKPNAAHYALVELEHYFNDSFTLITQNVDGLHTKAGNLSVVEMHGSLNRCYCTSCKHGLSMEEADAKQLIPLCPICGSYLRPDIVWFGEIPISLFEIENSLKKCDVFIIIGTSGVVYPAAGFVMTAKLMGAKTIAINLESPDNLTFLDEFYKGKSGDILPGLVKEWTGIG
ncbi:MAG: NAD-dependent protein deacylase [Candidatus Cloacimonetes bacterium HGW-Cloacimonetes-3]|jgi:NAD-dependent deacetylase|nr:MAG: NAD-dependent protein deacylase [Candidatus Cloacimonetes bacterium HGW-Cloacimonetes-3]